MEKVLSVMLHNVQDLRILQRNRSNKRDRQVDIKTYISVSLYIERLIYYKDLAHVIMEADKSQDLQGKSASSKPKRAHTIVPV